MSVLLIEKDSAVARSVTSTLRSNGMVVCTTNLGETGIVFTALYDPSVIVTCLNLPDINGLEVIRKIRRGNVQTPIIVLSGNAEVKAKVKALNSGADDYMTKPFNKDELVARILAVIRRSNRHSQSVITMGELTLNLETRTVKMRGQLVHLTKKEYQILELLSLRKGTILSRETFLNHLYGDRDDPGPKIINVFVCKIRRKLAAVGCVHQYIVTVCGHGYVLRDPDETLSALSSPMTVYDGGKPAVAL